MPNIVSSEVTADHVSATSSGGETVTITRALVAEMLNDLAGADADLTKQTVQRAVAQLISDALGPSNVLPDQIGFDYDAGSGDITDLSFFG